MSKCKLIIHIASNLNQDFTNALDFAEKNCFEKIKLCWKTRSQRRIYLVNIHHKNVQFGFFCAFSEKLFRKKLFFFPLNNFFWIKTFENIQFLNHLLYKASKFESRNSNASELEPFLHNSTIFESKFLERVRFRKKKFYNASGFEVKLICKKNSFWWKFCFQKITFRSFYPKERPLLQLCVFSKTNNSFKKRKKNSFPIKNFEKNQIL